MNFLSQVAGERSIFALYDIANLQFLYITYLPSAKSMQTALWQTRSKFEPRSAGGGTFYLRRDPESQREVAFAISGDYLILSTREDLMAGALQLMSGKQDRTVEGEQWWAQSTAAPSSDASHAALSNNTNCTFTDPSSGTSYSVSITKGSLSLTNGVLTVSGSGTADIFCSITLTGTATQ